MMQEQRICASWGADPRGLCRSSTAMQMASKTLLTAHNNYAMTSDWPLFVWKCMPLSLHRRDFSNTPDTFLTPFSVAIHTSSVQSECYPLLHCWIQFRGYRLSSEVALAHPNRTIAGNGAPMSIGLLCRISVTWSSLVLNRICMWLIWSLWSMADTLGAFGGRSPSLQIRSELIWDMMPPPHLTLANNQRLP